MNLLVLAFAFTQGVFPKPPDFSKLPAFDLAFFASHPRFTLFFLTALAIGVLVGFALLSARVQGVLGARAPGLHDPHATATATCARWSAGSRPRGSRASPPTGSCSTRSTSAARCATCCSCSACRSSRCSCPFTPGGAGVQQALLLTVFAGAATASEVAAFSVGQQIALAAAAVAMGFARARPDLPLPQLHEEVVQRGREHRRAEEEAPDKVTPASSF